MTEVKDNSSLPLLFSITGAILLVAVGGWFFLDQEPATPVTAGPPPSIVEPESTDEAAAQLPADVEAAPTAAENPAVPAVSAEEAAATAHIDAELRKARLAADADILVFPPDQSALHYYGSVMEADPEHAVARAELDAVLARVEQTVSAHLAAERFEQAYEIAVLVAEKRPNHALVSNTQQTLDALTEALVDEAIGHAQAGEDEQAEAALARAQALPGRNPQYFSAVRESIAEIRRVRLAAEQDRLQRAQLAAEQAREAWVTSVQNAINNGNLIAPAGASARDLLAEQNTFDTERAELRELLLSALVDRARSFIADDRLPEAETLVNAAVEVSGNPDGFSELRASLDSAFIEKESSRVANLEELVRLKVVPARYPRRAEERGLSGWVDVVFTVTPTGETDEIEVYAAEPETIFNRAAIEAVSQWTFQPREYRGQVISQRTGARLVFRLE